MQVLKKLKASPFGIAALAAILDLTGGLTSVIADIIWLVYDTAIKNPGEMLHHPVYIVILVMLIIGAILLSAGIYYTIKCFRKYITCGLEKHERKIIRDYIKSRRCDYDKENNKHDKGF